MRRTATVTHCVPDSSSAATIDSIDGYLPVPRNRRDVNECLPSTSGLSVRLLIAGPACCHGGRRLSRPGRQGRQRGPAARAARHFLGCSSSANSVLTASVIFSPRTFLK